MNRIVDNYRARPFAEGQKPLLFDPGHRILFQSKIQRRRFGRRELAWSIHRARRIDRSIDRSVGDRGAHTRATTFVSFRVFVEFGLLRFENCSRSGGRESSRRDGFSTAVRATLRRSGGQFGHPEKGRAPRHLVERGRKEGRKERSDSIRFDCVASRT